MSGSETNNGGSDADLSRKCRWKKCGATFTPKKDNQLFCRPQCKYQYHNKRKNSVWAKLKHLTDEQIEAVLDYVKDQGWEQEA